LVSRPEWSTRTTTSAARVRGELLIRGDCVFQGYWQNGPATQEVLRGGWLHTGDVAAKDEEGYYRIVDRVKT